LGEDEDEGDVEDVVEVVVVVEEELRLPFSLVLRSRNGLGGILSDNSR